MQIEHDKIRIITADLVVEQLLNSDADEKTHYLASENTNCWYIHMRATVCNRFAALRDT